MNRLVRSVLRTLPISSSEGNSVFHGATPWFCTSAYCNAHFRSLTSNVRHIDGKLERFSVHLQNLQFFYMKYVYFRASQKVVCFAGARPWFFRVINQFKISFKDIFETISTKYSSSSLEVAGRFMRRGGIDINPIRSNKKKIQFKNFRFFNQ